MTGNDKKIAVSLVDQIIQGARNMFPITVFQQNPVPTLDTKQEKSKVNSLSGHAI